ncbi:MAG TPA: dihydrofolate reductase family protein [Thermoanaerobaculia bacterium]
MGTISAFVHVSVDGFFAGPNGEIDWFKTIQKDSAYDAYIHQQSGSGDTLLMGRTTYEMMKSYWPTEDARKNDPAMASVMNDSPKIVFSKTLDPEQDWKNVTVVREIDSKEILALTESGDATILGSGTIVQQFTNLRLIDRYALVVVPLLLGAGKALFQDVDGLDLKLDESRSFGNGIVVSKYS